MVNSNKLTKMVRTTKTVDLSNLKTKLSQRMLPTKVHSLYVP